MKKITPHTFLINNQLYIDDERTKANENFSEFDEDQKLFTLKDNKISNKFEDHEGRNKDEQLKESDLGANYQSARLTSTTGTLFGTNNQSVSGSQSVEGLIPGAKP